MAIQKDQASRAAAPPRIKHADVGQGFWWARLQAGGQRFLVSVTGVAPFLSVHHVGSEAMSRMAEPHKLEFLSKAEPPQLGDSPPTIDELKELNTRVVAMKDHPLAPRGY